MKCNISCILLVVSTMIGGLGYGGGAVASILQEGEDVVIELKEGKTEGFLTLYVLSENAKKTYWQLNLNYYNGGEIVLGEVPEGPQDTYKNRSKVLIKQVVPEKKRPVFPKDRKLILHVEYYETFLFIAPGMRDFRLTFELDDNGRLKE